MPKHGKCGKEFPNGSRIGHCGACCETFVGLKAFDAHRRGEHGVDRHCEVLPTYWTDEDGNVRCGHWQDSRGFWHFGTRDDRFDTEEQANG